MTSSLGDMRRAPVASVASRTTTDAVIVHVAENDSTPTTFRQCAHIGTCVLLVAAGIAVGVWAAME